MSLESILLIGILTILAIAKLAEGIAFGADCLWSLVIRSYLLNTSDLAKEADSNRFLEIAVNVQSPIINFCSLFC